MIHDLRTILDGWDYEPGKISVRKIVGRDGREKIQTRVDLGLLQFETSGRPDGMRPHGYDSLLDCLEARVRERAKRHGAPAGFSLTADDCRELRHESHLYYQRYLSLFVLEEYGAVIRDTTRNLRLLDFIQQYAEAESDRDALEAQRAYIMMMRTRAKVYAALADERYEDALLLCDDGIDELAGLNTPDDEGAYHGDGDTPELRVLASLREEIIETLPADSPARLQIELERALDDEDYERAAQLRDRLDESRKPSQ